MPCEHARTFIDSLTALGPLVVAGIVAYIGYRQYRTNVDKLRLDLYDRRFSIYLAALDYYYALTELDPTSAEYVSAGRQFIKAIRESRFLFGIDSEPVRMLEEIRVRANTITAFAEIGEKVQQSDSKMYLEMFATQSKNLLWIGSEEGLLELERAMAPFLDFRQAAA